MNTSITKKIQRYSLYIIMGLLFLLPALTTTAQTNCSNAISIYEGFQGNFVVQPPINQTIFQKLIKKY